MGFFSDITEGISGILDGISPGAAAVALGPLALGGGAAGFGADALAGEGSIMGQGAAAGGGLTGNALGLQQMGIDAGLTGSALSNFVASGGGATIAGGAGGAATTSLIQQLASYTGLSTGAIERLGGAAISSLAGLYGANKLGQASMDAANRLAGANQTATQLQSKMYEDQVARQQPFYQAGVNALGPYTTGIMGTEEERRAGRPGALVRPFDVNRDYAQSPWYQASLTKKLKDYTNKLGSMGLVDSGPMRRGVLDIAGQAGQEDIMGAYNRYNQDLATQRGAYGNLAGFAPPAAAQIGAAGANYGANVNNLGTSTARNYAGADLTSAAARQSAYAGAGGAFNEAFNPDPRTAFYNNMMRVG